MLLKVENVLRLTKMEMEVFFNNVNHLIECERFVVERVTFLEQKRKELIYRIHNLVASSYKITLQNQINQMAIKVIRNTEFENKNLDITTVVFEK